MLMAYEEELDTIDTTGEVTLFDARLGGFQTLAKLLTSATQRRKRRRKLKDVGQQRLDCELVATGSCLLALQARLTHEYRYLIAGVHQNHNLVESSAVLRALAAALFRAVTGEQHDDATRKGTRDAVLYAVSLSSAVFLPTVIGGGDAAQRPPACRALVGRQLVETLWLERLAEAITHHAAGMQPTETTRMRLALSILAHSSYDSRQARQALLQCPGLLPYLVRGVCRAKGVDTGVRLWSLCVLNNCTSTDPCLDDDTQLPTAQHQQEVAGVVGPALEVLIQHCGLVPYLYGLLIASVQERHGSEEQPEGDSSRAAVMLSCECLLHCLAYCPASTLASLHERGALLSFPVLLCPPPLTPHDGSPPPLNDSKAHVSVQRLGVAMLSAMVDLYSRRPKEGKQTGASIASQGLRRQSSGSVRRGSQSGASRPQEGDTKGGKGGPRQLAPSGSGKLSVLSKDASLATKVPLARPPPPPLAPPEFVALLAASGGLVPMAWLLLHTDHKVQSHARRVWRFLLVSTGDGSGSLAAGWVESFIEQGGVPILFLCTQRRPEAKQTAEGRMVRMAEGVEGGEGESTALARQLLQALQGLVQQPDLLSRLVCCTTSVTLAPRQRGHIATTLLLLSCGAPRVRESFVRNGGLHCILNMMHNPTTRDAAVSFLMAVDSLVEQEHRPQCWQTYVEDEAGDLLFEEPPVASADAPPLHRVVGDVVIHVQTTELSKRKTVIEMACPPAHVIKQASPVLQGLLEEAEATGTRATVQGSYKVWEEIMSHIAQPSCFGRARTRYSPELLVDMMHTAHRYGLWELKTVYGVRLSCFLDESSAVTLLHAALQAQHSWLALEAHRVLLASVEYVCSRSARALPLAVQLMEELLTCLLLG